MIRYKILFYDNEKENIETLEQNVPNVEGILINHDIKNKLGNNNAYRQYWIDRGNTYAIYFPNFLNIEPTEGFNKEHAEQLLLRARSGEKLIAIFDWDRTLNVLEGVNLPPNYHRFEEYGVNPEHAIQYQMGGSERLEWLRDMFRQLDQLNVPVFILTSNGSCNLKKYSFLTHIQRLIPSLTDDRLICAGQLVGLNKAQALLQNETYQHITGWSKVNIMVIVSVIIMILVFLFPIINRAQMGVYGKKGDDLSSFIKTIKSLLDKANITLTKSRILNYIEENTNLTRDQQDMLISLTDYSYKELLEFVKKNDLVKFVLEIKPYDIIKTILDYSLGIIGMLIQKTYTTTAALLSFIFNDESTWWDWDAWLEGSEGTRKKFKRKSRKKGFFKKSRSKNFSKTFHEK